MVIDVHVANLRKFFYFPSFSYENLSLPCHSAYEVPYYQGVEQGEDGGEDDGGQPCTEDAHGGEGGHYAVQQA